MIINHKGPRSPRTWFLSVEKPTNTQENVLWERRDNINTYGTIPCALCNFMLVTNSRSSRSVQFSFLWWGHWATEMLTVSPQVVQPASCWAGTLPGNLALPSALSGRSGASAESNQPCADLTYWGVIILLLKKLNYSRNPYNEIKIFYTWET